MLSYNILILIYIASCCELTLTHDIIKEGASLWRTHILPGAQPSNGNINSWLRPVILPTCLNNNTTQNIILLFSLPQHTPRVPETDLNHSCSTSRSYKSGCCKASASDINSCSKIAPRLQHLHQGNAVNK